MTETRQEPRTRRRPAEARHPLLNTRVLQVALLIALLASWQATEALFNTGFWTSSPIAVIERLIGWAQSGVLWSALSVTLTEAGIGFVVGSLVGAAFGFAIGWNTKLGEVLEPFVLALYTLPKIALAPLFVLWFGIGLLNKIMFAGLMVFFMVFFNSFQGARQVDRKLVDNARLLGASRPQIWRTIALPHASVWLFSGLRLGLPYAVIGAVVGEFVAAQEGVGYRIKEATAFYDTAAVFAGLLVLMAMSTTFLFLLTIAERRILKWKKPATFKSIARDAGA